MTCHFESCKQSQLPTMSAAEASLCAQNDQKFVEWQQHMRRTDIDQPVYDEFIARLQLLQSTDLETDPNWAFAPIGVFSKWERDTINYSQARNFAKTFDLPFVRWPLTIVVFCMS